MAVFIYLYIIIYLIQGYTTPYVPPRWLYNLSYVPPSQDGYTTPYVPPQDGYTTHMNHYNMVIYNAFSQSMSQLLN